MPTPTATHYIIIALHKDEDPRSIASDLSEMLGHAGVVREVLNLDAPSPLLDAVKASFKPGFENEE